MLKRFYPTRYVNSIYEIDYDDLMARKKTGLLFDLDNTIAPFDVKEPTEKIVLFFKDLLTKGFKICILSNNSLDRVQLFNQNLQQKILAKAGKPKKRGIYKALALIETEKENSVMIGDQMFTDIWVSNRMGMESILVKPIANKDEFTVKLKRGIEKKVFNRYMRSVENDKSRK